MKKDKAETLTIPNSELLRYPSQMLGSVLGEFLSQPLPILVMLDLKPACDGAIKRAGELAELKLGLIKKHGGTEAPDGGWELQKDAPGYAAFLAEYDHLKGKEWQVPGLPGKVRVPPRVQLQGKDIDIVMSGAAVGILGCLVEVER